MKKIFFLSLLLFLSFITFAQNNFEVPKNVVLKEKADYKPYEPDVIAAAKWIENTPLDQQEEKRARVNAFLLAWINGCPLYDINITDKLRKLNDKNEQFLVIYMASYSRNMAETQNYSDQVSASRAGLLSIMKVYEKDIDIKKSKEMEKLIRIRDAGTLDEYIKANWFVN